VHALRDTHHTVSVGANENKNRHHKMFSYEKPNVSFNFATSLRFARTSD
jgi:hypothetical protein